MNYNDQCKQAANVNYSFDYSESKPISSWGYVGYLFLWAIPVIGWLIWLCNCFSKKNANVRNYARSQFCQFILAIILVLVMALLVFVAITMGVITPEMLEGMMTTPPVA